MYRLPVLSGIPGIRELPVACGMDEPTRMVEEYVDPWWVTKGPILPIPAGLDVFERQVSFLKLASRVVYTEAA